MNETQFNISVAVVPVTTIIIVLIGVLLNNGNMNRRRDDLKDVMRAGSDRHDATLQRVEEVTSANLRRVEDMLLGKFTELDTRLSRIEHHLNLS